MSDALNHLINGELEMFKKAIEANLYSKVGDTLSQRKKEIAADMFTEEECSSCAEQVDESNLLNELGDTFKGKLRLAGYAGRRFGQLKGLERREEKMQKEKEGLMNLIRSGNAPPLSYLNNFTNNEYALQMRGNRMARGIRSAVRAIGPSNKGQ